MGLPSCLPVPGLPVPLSHRKTSTFPPYIRTPLLFRTTKPPSQPPKPAKPISRPLSKAAGIRSVAERQQQGERGKARNKAENLPGLPNDEDVKSGEQKKKTES